jgi:hypothetical protein
MSDEFDPLTGDPLPKTNKRETGSNSQATAQSATNPASIDASLLSRLEEMPRAELRTLLERINPDKLRVLAMSEEEQAQAMLDALAIMALTSDDDKAVLNAIREWLDRKQGKSIQRQAIMAEINDKRSMLQKGIEKMGSRELEALIGFVESGG